METKDPDPGHWGMIRMGAHRGCGGCVELVEYAVVCTRCGAQDWNETTSGPYVEDLLEQLDLLPLFEVFFRYGVEQEGSRETRAPSAELAKLDVLFWHKHYGLKRPIEVTRAELREDG
jgi:hypothetical protein